jgi:Na+-transporting NADH:ubiquinone oxidoreductase subunit C
MSQDSALKTVGVSVGICLFCSLFVSVAAVKLKPRQIHNQQLDKIENILLVAGMAGDGVDAMTLYQERIKPELIELSTGRRLSEDDFDDTLNIEDFDIKVMSRLADYSLVLAGSEDLAGIKRQPLHMVVYQLEQGGSMSRLILPIYGKGLWSTLYGFLALESDLQTVAGITFYEHGETPGLGGEVDNPNWKGSWEGKEAYDAEGNVVISVIKGQVVPNSPDANRQIDGLSGATLTARGVDNLIQFWLGEKGYGPYLKRLREERSL